MNTSEHKRYRPEHRVGLGGAVGLGYMRRQTPEAEAFELLQTAWDLAIHYYDTSPWYGLGLSERRQLICCQHESRILNHFDYQYDYSASATRRSIEESLHR